LSGVSHIHPRLRPTGAHTTPATSGHTRPEPGGGNNVTREDALAWRPCSTPGCGKLHQGTGKCPTCRAKVDRDRRPDGNPYATPGHRTFREHVLARDPVCVLCLARPSTVADHYPTERRDLVTQGLDPDDPDRGRGLCKPCHDRHTARTSPGGWHARNE